MVCRQVEGFSQCDIDARFRFLTSGLHLGVALKGGRVCKPPPSSSDSLLIELFRSKAGHPLTPVEGCELLVDGRPRGMNSSPAWDETGNISNHRFAPPLMGAIDEPVSSFLLQLTQTN